MQQQNYDVVNQVPMVRFDGVQGSKLYLVDNIHKWKAFYELLMQQKLVCCDTETEGFYWYKTHRICGLSFGWGDTHFYVPVRHKASLTNGPVLSQVDMDAIRSDLIAFFSQEDLVTVWHNWKFDAHFYRADGIEMSCVYHDTRILWQLYDENAPGALKTIASGWKDDLGRACKGLVDPQASQKEKLLDKWRADEATERRKAFNGWVKAEVVRRFGLPEYQQYTKKELKEIVLNSPEAGAHPYYVHSKESVDYSYVPIELMCEYAGLDTYLTWRVFSFVMKNLSIVGATKKLYINEIKLSRVLFEAECAGVKIDRAYLELLGTKYDEEIINLTAKVYDQFGFEFNLNSNQQLADALQKAGVPLTKLTDSGQLAVDSKVLKKLANKHPIVKDILDLRGIEKLRNTYVSGILEKLTDDDILHCSFNQNVATGRMSSTDPNLQNIPGRDKSIRKAFIRPSDEWIYVLMDYSQVEVRLTADYSQDPLLLSAYENDQDVHTRTMCEMFGFKYEEVAPVIAAEDKSHPQYSTWDLLRTIAKRINFGIIYGVGAPGLSEQIPRPDQYKHLDEPEWIKVCQSFIDQYLDKYRGVKKFVNQGGREVRLNSQVVNRFGRVRHLPWANACKILNDKSKYWLEARAKRQGVNFLVQGTAADLFKIAVVRIFDILVGHKSHIVNFVHDEVQIYLHKSEKHLLADLKAAMEDFKQFSVPIVADLTYSTTNWAEKKKI